MPDKQIKVVHISTFFNGGAGRAAYRIHESLYRNGVESTFLNLESEGGENSSNVFLERPRPFKKTFVQWRKDSLKYRIQKHFGIQIEFEREIVEKKILELSPMLDCEIATSPFSIYNLLDNQFVQDADVIHLHWVGNLLDYQSFFKNNKKPVVWTFHDMNPIQGLFHYKDDENVNKGIAGKLDNIIKSIKGNAIRKRSCQLEIICPSVWLLKEARKTKWIRKFAGKRIVYPINTNTFFFERTQDFKKLKNIPSGNIVLLYVADLFNRRKGFDILVEAIGELLHIPLTLLVLGSSEAFIKEGVDIRNVGRINTDEELRQYYSEADAFIITSREDNLPNVMLESLACGTPVIGFSIGGLIDHIITYKTGILADEVSSGALALAINNFYLNKHLFNRNEIEQYATAEFCEKRVADQYKDVYSTVLKKDRLGGFK